MTAVSIIIDVILILVSIALIAAVLMQQGQRQGLGAIGGGAETFFGKNAANSAEGKLKQLTKILAVVFIVLAIVATIVTAHINKDALTESEALGVLADELNAAIEGEETTEGEEAAEGETTEGEEADAEATAEPTEEPAEEATAEPTEEPTEAPTATPTAAPAA